MPGVDENLDPLDPPEGDPNADPGVGDPNQDPPEGTPPEGDPKEDTPAESPEFALLRDRFGDRFASVEEAFDNIAVKERTITQTQQELGTQKSEISQLKGLVARVLQQQDQKPPVTDEQFAEQFAETPLAAVEGQFVSKAEHERTNNQVEMLNVKIARAGWADSISQIDPDSDFGNVANYIRQNIDNPQPIIPPAGLSKAWDKLQQVLPRDDPSWGSSIALKTIYGSLKAQDAPTAPVTVVPEPKKTKARTHSGSAPTRTEAMPANIDNMSAAQLEAWIEKNRKDLIRDK